MQWLGYGSNNPKSKVTEKKYQVFSKKIMSRHLLKTADSGLIVVKHRLNKDAMDILFTGGTGYVGSHTTVIHFSGHESHE